MTNLPFIQRSEPVIIVGAQPDGTETYAVRASASGELGVEDILTQGGLENSITVGTVAIEAKVGITRLGARKSLTVMPTTGKIFWGFNSTVTVATGTPIFKNQLITFAANCAIWLIAAANTTVQITEGK
jgi:hypothetical protein